MQSLINTFLDTVKWPLALLMLLLVIPAFKTDMLILQDGVNRMVLTWFFLPMLAMIVAWFTVPGFYGSFLSIFEHEATHMLFAVLTFHSPRNIEINQGGGGSFSFRGRGNWLIALAPYFFPTFAVLVMAASLLYAWTGEPLPNQYWAVFGVMTGYHIASTLLEIHPKQTDFKVAGYVFSLLFLPGANLISYGILLSFACYGPVGIGRFIRSLIDQTSLFIGIFV